MIDFLNYHLHSNYSLLDGLSKVTDIVDKSIQLNQRASCITDHGNMYSIVRHFQYAQKLGQKAIAGFEAYIVPDRLKRGAEGESEASTTRNHMVLLAKNHEGYRKLCRICSEGFITGMYYRPRIDDAVLRKYLNPDGENDLISTSACLAGSIAQFVLKGEYEKADKQIEYYRRLFNDNFYLELQPVEMYEQYLVNKYYVEYSKNHSVPLVMATDAHYLNREDKATHDVLLCMQSSNVMSNDDRWAFPGNSYYMMSAEEALSFFDKKYAFKKIRLKNTKKGALALYRYKYVYDYEGEKFHFPESVFADFDRVEEEGGWDNNVLDKDILRQACEVSGSFIDQCDVSFSFDKHYLPKITIPENLPSFNEWNIKQQEKGVNQKPNEAYLKFLCLEGLKKKFPNISAEYRQILLERLKYELGVINSMEFPDYFLIYYDIINFCNASDIPVGPGRGCFSGDNIVRTSRGYKYLKDIKVDDMVFSHDEKLHTVVDTFVYDIDEDVLTITAEDNISINNVTLDHKIYAIKKEDFDNGIREPRWIEACKLKEEDYICLAEHNGSDSK